MSAELARCEATHIPAVASGLFMGRGSDPRTVPMKTRRMAYWWFRFVISGRFLEKFLNPRSAK
jgi:hypothetical protein